MSSEPKFDVKRFKMIDRSNYLTAICCFKPYSASVIKFNTLNMKENKKKYTKFNNNSYEFGCYHSER